MAELTVYPETLRWAVRAAQVDPGAVSRREGLQNFPQWLERTDPISISFQKVHELSVALQTTFGALVRSVVPREQADELIQYRTIENESVEPSKNLLDTISMMRVRQTWARDEKLQAGLGRNSLVGMLESTASDEEIARAMVEALDLREGWAKGSDERVRFKQLKERASARGLMVMVNSQVESWRRKLDIEEFRAFALVDPIAPLIFINRNDSYSGMLFSLLHEIGHVLLGKPEIFNDGNNEPNRQEFERRINRAVLKSVMSDETFASAWQQGLHKGLSELETANDLAQHYGLSALSFAIRARQAGFSDEHLVDELREQMLSNLSDKERNKAKGDGGNGNLTNGSRLDTGFVQLVQGSIERGALSYTDGFALLGLKSERSYDALLRLKGLA
ncbi:hypothetical protein KIM372_01150 [Bombiscardovia nodaiensis]|uniref:IrrE N-terminal-like domain-containing protein n=1 Tax=Bombiscardovia nodaiensis TaxID=2932181 RepID=A0ABM8B5U9_9BIFI|nr:hypothetical protein KIM372_01150 [Bombiscardovia nodaiensis]